MVSTPRTTLRPAFLPSRRQFLAAVGVCAFGAGRHARAAGAAGCPNILFLFSDDQRADAMGCAGNPAIKTPHMDRLAADGIRFRNAFVTTSICCVSRACVLTGQYARRHGIHDFARPLSDEAMAVTYPMRLKQAGYTTGFIGKWGIAANTIKQVTHAGASFDFWAGASHQSNFWHEADCPFVTQSGTGPDRLANICTCPPDARGRRGPGVRMGRKNIRKPVHLTTQIIPAKVDEFLRTRDRARPFCLSISFKAPHAPWGDWAPETRDLYREGELPVPATATPEAMAAKPAFLRGSLGSPGGARLAGDHAVLRRQIAHYYRLVSTLDIAVGKIRETLARHGLADNTVILFSSDNGHFLAEHGLMGKWLMYEPSIRVPLIIADPRLPAAARGRTCDELALNIDFAPTMLDLAGLPSRPRMQGRSLVPLLTRPETKLREDFFYEHLYRTKGHPIERTEGVRTRRWKYIRFIDQKPAWEELYDLEADPHETRNLAGDAMHRATLERLRARWQLYTRELT